MYVPRFSVLTRDTFGSDVCIIVLSLYTQSARWSTTTLSRNSLYRFLTQGASPFQDHTRPDMHTRGDSQGSSIIFVYRSSGCDTANEPTLGNMEKMLRLSAPKHGLNAVLGQIMYVSSWLLSLYVVSDVS